MRKKILIILFTLILTSILTYIYANFVQNKNNNIIIGMYESTDKMIKMQIYPCEKAFCGKIISFKSTDIKKEKKKNPKFNKDLKDSHPFNKESKNLIGLKILWDVTYNNEANEHYGNAYEYINGKYYNITDGLTYNCNITWFEGRIILYLHDELDEKEIIWNKINPNS